MLGQLVCDLAVGCWGEEGERKGEERKKELMAAEGMGMVGCLRDCPMDPGKGMTVTAG